MSEQRVKAWVCSVCGYVHYGSEPPEECPVCGVDSGMFELELVPAPAAPAAAGRAALKVVVAGAGIAGVSAAEAARKNAPDAEIWLLSNETDLPYYRINLTRYLAGEIDAGQLDLHPESWYAANGIRLLCGVELSAIDLATRAIDLDSGERLSYDRLILATGARAFLPPVPGAQARNVNTLRTRHDAEAVLSACRGKSALCIGGGILGLETAGALARQGVAVTVLENQAWLMPRQLNQRAARVFQGFVEGLGITVLSNVKVKELTGDGLAQRVVFEDGASLPVENVIFSTGVRANSAAALQSGLAVKNAVLVDDAMRASQGDVFAAGDAAEHAGVLYGTWVPAQTQGTVAGTVAAGGSAAFRALPRSTTLKVLGIDLFSIGETSGEWQIESEGPNHYTGFFFRDSILTGAILLGDASASAAVKKAVENRMDCGGLLAKNPTAAEISAHLQR